MKILDYSVAIIDTDTHIGKWVQEHGKLDFDNSFFKAISKYVKNDMTIVDVGANIGAYSYGFYKLLGANGVIHCFEPLPHVYECLEYNVNQFKSKAKIYTYNEALGSKVGKAKMVTDVNVGASRISSEGDIEIKLNTLDSYNLPKCDLIKVDIEGYEVDFLEGAKHTITKYKPIIIMEVNGIQLERQGKTQRQLFNVLTGLGYNFSNIYPSEGMTGLQFDIICF